VTWPCRYPLFALLVGFFILFSLPGCSPAKKGMDHDLDNLENRLVELENEEPAPKIDAQKVERLVIIMKFGPAISYDQPTQKDAVITLGLLGRKEAVPALIEQFQISGDNNFKSYIANSLGWIGDKSAIPVLKKALKSKNVHLRKRAALALKKITGKSYL
jgi:HEAT repeat protein